jgi:DNA polymerase III subunit gamma/tau
MESESIDELIAKYESKPLPSMPLQSQIIIKKEIVQAAPEQEVEKIAEIETIAVAQEQVIQQAEASPKPSINSDSLWKKFVEKVYDRSYETGQLIEKILTFEGFDGEVLQWSSNANDEEKELLRKDYGTIRHIVQSIYGIEVAIKLITRSEGAPTAVLKLVPQESKNDEPTTANSQDDNIGISFALNTPDALGVALGIHEPMDVAPKSLLEHPLVKKSIDVFGANPDNVILHNKA